MRRLLLTALLFLCLLFGLSAITPTLTYYGVLDKEKVISIPIPWKTQDLKDSSLGYDDTLAKAAVCLARSIYISDEAVKKNLLELGFTQAWVLDEEGVSNPVVAFAHQKKLGIHYYALVIRGTATFLDWITDFKAINDYFVEAGSATMDEFLDYCSEVLHKDIETLKTEENVFFVVGHSMGAAVANHLSTLLLELTAKNKIFTYTFESPSTGVESEYAEESNAINIINREDFIPDVPFPQGRFGRDIFFIPEELDPEIYQYISGKKLKTIEKFSVFSHFDNHLLDCSLTYVLSREQGKLREVEEPTKD